MIAIVTAITVMLSLVVSAFLSFSPNFSRMVEKDFMRKAYGNALSHNLKYGQLCIRAGTLESGEKKELIIPLKEKDESFNGSGSWVLQSQLNSTITIVGGTDVEVSTIKEIVNE